MLKMEDCKALLVESLLTAAGQVNSVIIGSVLLCCTVIGLRFVGKKEVEVWKVPVKLTYFPLVALLLSVAHAYCAGLLELRANDLLGSGDELRRCAWQKLTTNGPIIFQGMNPRTLVALYQIPLIGSLRIYQFSRTDYTTILSIAMGLAAIVAVIASSVDFDITGWWKQRVWRRQVLIIFAALSIGFVNWTIGSWWAVEVSKVYVGSTKVSEAMVSVAGLVRL
jgi:hypothetical protein